MAQSTDIFWEDQFDREDSTDLANNWTVSAGALQIVNGAVQQSGAGATNTSQAYITGTTAAASLGADYGVSVRLSCDDATTARQGLILLRRDGTDGYLVGLEWDDTGAAEALTLKIIKRTGASDTTLASVDVTAEMNTSSSSFDNVIQLVGAYIYDDVDGVQIDAFFNDEERPRLSATDNVYPNFKQGGAIGLEFQDNDVGVDGHVMLHGIRVVGLQDRSEKGQVIAAQYTAGYLRNRLREMALRDSHSRLDDATFLQLINEANQELHAELVRAPWLTEIYEFSLVANEEAHELPADTSSIGSEVWDTSSQRALQVISFQQFRAMGRTENAGVPEVFYLGGYGDAGGMNLRPYPKASGNRSYTVARYRQPRILVNDEDIPDLPQELCTALLWGGLFYYTLRDSDRSHMQMANAKWEMWKSRVKKYRDKHEAMSGRVVVKHAFNRGPRIKSVLETARYGVRR